MVREILLCKQLYTIQILIMCKIIFLTKNIIIIEFSHFYFLKFSISFDVMQILSLLLAIHYRFLFINIKILYFFFDSIRLKVVQVVFSAVVSQLLSTFVKKETNPFDTIKKKPFNKKRNKTKIYKFMWNVKLQMNTTEYVTQ